MITMPTPPNLAEDRRLLNRDDALSDVLRYTLSQAGLSHDAEQAIRKAMYARIDPLLHLADDATMARAELEAVDRALDTHAQTCAGCCAGYPCQRSRLLQVRLKRYREKSDRAFRALLEGRRR
jgi:hypothetical protein